MTEATGYVLVSTAALTALLHTLIPDHWLPFLLIGRARGQRFLALAGEGRIIRDADTSSAPQEPTEAQRKAGNSAS